MIPELGLMALILALALALVQSGAGLTGGAGERPGWRAAARGAARGQALMLLLAFLALMYSFIVNDFSVLYVAQNSNTELPLLYRIAAVWGAHEGSMLLWVLILSGWTVAVTLFSRSLEPRFAARVLGVLGLVSSGFLLFILLTSNPFERLFPAAVQGRDLNPILQDPALAAHPPMLYTGYVGMSVAFAFAVAALIGGELKASWARWVRPWTTAAWMFLTVGIALGSWWSYYELGWGGWWFWDPVENASFMPWLAATALLHSLAVTEKRGAFINWTVLLAIFAFTLSMLGTFLVRSGVLVSVHAFATDPSRGVFILAFLGAVLGLSLGLYAWRAPKLPPGGGFALFSRETLLLINNLLLSVATVAVLLGTLYPLFMDVLNLGKISVGPPYFNAVFVPVMSLLVLAMGLGPVLRWKKDNPGPALRRVLWAAVASVVAAILVVAFGGAGTLAGAIGVLLALWAISAAFLDPLKRWRKRVSLPRHMLGMSLAHFGVGIVVLGITIVSTLGVEHDRVLKPGGHTDVAGYRFTFAGTHPAEGPNYDATVGGFVVTRNGNPVTNLHPEKRTYRVQRSPMTEAAIDPGLFRDLYVALGTPVGDGAWSFRVQYKPFVRFIWLGALIMAFGGLLALSDRRYRRSGEGER